MKFINVLTNRTFAFFVVALIFFASSYGGVYKSTPNIPQKAEDAFNNGFGDAKYGIQYYLNYILDDAANLCKIAKKYEPSFKTETDTTQAAMNKLKSAETPDGKHIAMTELLSSLTELYNNMAEAGINGEDLNNADKMKRSADSYSVRIANVPYNDYLDELQHNVTTLQSFLFKKRVTLPDTAYFK